MSGAYTDLLVWQKSMDLVVEVYRLVKELPQEERYALSDQMRRAVVSAQNLTKEVGRMLYGLIASLN